MAKDYKLVVTTDGVIDKFARELAQVGQGKARVAMSRAVNYGGRRAEVQVKRALVRQTSIPRAIVNGSLRTRSATTKPGGTGPIEFVILGTGSEIPLEKFGARQFAFGVRAKVWGKMQRFPGMFGAAGDTPAVVAALNGAVFHRTGKSRLPIERSYGPSVPKEMVLGETKAAFEETAPDATQRRLFHELKRMLAF